MQLRTGWETSGKNQNISDIYLYKSYHSHQLRICCWTLDVGGHHLGRLDQRFHCCHFLHHFRTCLQWDLLWNYCKYFGRSGILQHDVENMFYGHNIGYIWEPALTGCASHTVQIFGTTFSNCLWLCGHYVLQTCQIFEKVFSCLPWKPVDFVAIMCYKYAKVLTNILFLPVVNIFVIVGNIWDFVPGYYVLQICQSVDKYFVPACRESQLVLSTCRIASLLTLGWLVSTA